MKKEGRTYSATSSLEASVLSSELLPRLNDGGGTNAAEVNTWSQSSVDVALLSIKGKTCITKEHSLKTEA